MFTGPLLDVANYIISQLAPGSQTIPADQSVPLHEQASFTFDVNYFGLQAFTKEMAPLIKRRLVNVGSSMSMFGFQQCAPNARRRLLNMGNRSVADLDKMVNDYLDETHREYELEFGDFPYAMSKVFQRALTYKQAELYKDIVVLQGCPGLCDTGILPGNIGISPELGGKRMHWLATTEDPAVVNSKGGFFMGRKMWKFDDDIATYTAHVQNTYNEE